MKAYVTLIVALVAFVAFVATPAKASTTIYSNGFETDTTDWSAATRVASGTNGITSAAGSFHAEAGADNFSRWGGYNYGAGNNVPTTFKEYTTSVDIYLDVAGAVTNNLADNTRLDFDSAVSNSAGGFLRDFIFNGGFYDDTTNVGDGSPGAGTNRFVFTASNNSQPGGAFAKNPGRSPISISTTGWYTFEHHFYDNAGLLSVGMTIRDSANALVGSWTLGGTDAISGVGGNRYGWFDDNEFPVLAYDNASLTVVPEPTAIALLGLGAGALLLRRRRRPA